MPLTDEGKAVMLNAYAGAALYASIHTADPTTTAATAASNEATGGSPAYARQSVTWNAAATGNLDSSNQPVFDLPAGTYTHFGIWKTLAGTTDADFVGSGALSGGGETLNAQGTYTLSDLDVTL